jgi:molecular chaperone HtpG
MSATATLRLEDKPSAAAQTPSIGKDLLELLSSAMYEDPLTLYREYVQNAADSIDQARANGVLPDGEGSIEILIDPATRNVRIRDDGSGIASEAFTSRMRSVGSSNKRGTTARGFRGVGRLSGLAYAQRLTFRCRSSGADAVRQITWDCRKLRAGLKDRSQTSLSEFIDEITELDELAGDWPERFFEVELSGVVRYGDDRLVRPETVSDYLAQIAPVPFAPEFTLGPAIASWIDTAAATKHLRITINGSEPIFRPHRDVVQPEGKQLIHLRELETFEVPAVDGGVAARGWVVHHDYQGAVPVALLKGLRVRAGDIQVGTASLLEDVFPEPRFGSWTIGEVHIQDSRIVPNGRRDGFEQNIHFANLRNHLAPVARGIAKRCRTNSSLRQRRRTFEAQAALAEQKLDVLEQLVLASGAQLDLMREVESHVALMDKIARNSSTVDQPPFQERLITCRSRLAAISTEEGNAPLRELSGERAEGVREVINLIYECSSDIKSAKVLVDRILNRLQ